MNASVHTEAMTATQRISLAYTLAMVGAGLQGSNEDTEEDDSV